MLKTNTEFCFVVFFVFYSSSRWKMCVRYVLTCDQDTAEAQQGELTHRRQVKLHPGNCVNELRTHTLLFLCRCSSQWEPDFPEKRKFPKALSLSIWDQNQESQGPHYLDSVRNAQDVMTNKLWLLFNFICVGNPNRSWWCHDFSPHEQYKDPKTLVFSCHVSQVLLHSWHNEWSSNPREAQWRQAHTKVS